MKQRKVLVAVVVLVAVSAMMPVQARGLTGPRKAKAPYQVPAIGGHIWTPVNETWAYAWDCGREIGCAVFELERGDRFASFEVQDATGLPVYAEVITFGGEVLGSFCSRTTEPIDVRGAGLALIHILAGTCPDLTPSTPTTGVVDATFFKRR